MTSNDKFRIERGMKVVDENGNPVGNLQNIYSEDQSGASRFINVEGRLLPVETIKGVEGDRVKLTMNHERVRKFPEQSSDQMPSREDQQRAYDLLGQSGPAGSRP